METIFRGGGIMNGLNSYTTTGGPVNHLIKEEEVYSTVKKLSVWSIIKREKELVK